MKLNYARNAKDPTYTIANTVRNGSKISTVTVAVIGKHSELLKITNDPLDYAKKKVAEYNRSLKENVVKYETEVNLNKTLDPEDRPASKPTYMNIGYLYLQNIYHQLGLSGFFRDVTSDRKITFDCDLINRFLTYARILDPKSKLGTFDNLDIYFEKPDFEYHQIMRFMDVLEENSYAYLKHLFQHSDNIVKRNTAVMYYDCTNYYFECEQEDEDYVDEVTGEIIQGLRRYGCSKEHRPNPIVEMGLIMDTQGIPVTMCIHPGNTNEQVTAIPLEKDILDMIGTTKFIYCSDGGLGSYNIRQFNAMGGRAFIVTQSIKKLSDTLKQSVFNDCDYRLLSNDKKVSIKRMKTFDRTNPDNRALYNDKAYKVIRADQAVDLGLFEEKHYKNGKTKMVKDKGNLKQRIIITFSRKMMEYQRSVRNRQIERAERLIKNGDPEEIKKGPNDVRRFMKRVAKSKTGEDVKVQYEIDEAKIKEEEKYDGYYAIATNLEDPAKDILAISEKRYQIEDCFRTMKTNFSARPVYHHKHDRIKAHFLICFTALLIYRLIEVKMKENSKGHTIDELLNTLKSMNVVEEYNAYYRALYTGSTTLNDLVSVFELPLNHEYYQARGLRNLAKKLAK
jgi:transposase